MLPDHNKKYGIAFALVLILLPLPALGADVITNGTFDSDITTGWVDQSVGADGSTSWDNTVYGAASGSMKSHVSVRNSTYTGVLSQSIGTINSTDNVTLSLYWYKLSIVRVANISNMFVEITKPSLTIDTIWSETTAAQADTPISNTVTNQNVSSFFDESGIYTLRLIGVVRAGNGAEVQVNFDDVVLDVTGASNQAPTVSTGATQVVPASVNRIGSNTTTISADFTDLDSPGIGAFNCTFKINDVSEYTLVNNQPNGGGGLTITDNGGGSYTASYTYNPDDATHATGVYDLYFEVSDGTDNAIDGYANNTNELTITQQNVPTIATGAAQVVPSSVNRIGSNTTTISADFTDLDSPGVGAFNCTFKINDVSEYTLVNNQPNGGGGLTIIDNGGGSYTASYVYNPDDATHATGDYDLYFEVSDGADNAIDGYANNTNELTITQQTAPTVVADATEAVPATVNRIGTNTTTISTDFTDLDQPAVSSFTVTFKVKDVSEAEYTLVDALTHGNGGLTVTDNTGGSYTASYTWDPGDAQVIGDYDLYFYVSDGTDNVTDGYIPNANELLVENIAANNPPTVVADATEAVPASVNWVGANTTTISTDFNDTDEPAVSSFTVTFKVKDVGETEYTLVNALTDGNGGLTVTDNTGGSYTASYTWDPGAGQTLGDYDLYFYVSDGTDNVTDDYTPNANELTITQQTAPTVVASATQVVPSTVNRIGANTTTISADFTDVDQPGIGAFNCTFKINDVSEYVLVNNQPNGGGGLTITDNTGGSYTASYTYNPDDAAHATGTYDLYFEVSDGTDNAIDGYASNPNELTINELNAPTVVASAAQVVPASVNRIGANTTTISADFTDIDQPGVGAFNCTFKINDVSEYVLVDNQPNGSGGLTITDNTGGSYTASYTYNPDDAAHATGTYDLYFEVSDGDGSAIDGYANNTNELTITQQTAPTVVADATEAVPATVNRVGTSTTTISTDFTDLDQPAVSSFTVTFKVKDVSEAEYTLVDALTHGNGGLTVTDIGGGSFTASYTWDPGEAQAIGDYDLYFYVSDGIDNVTDDYVANANELNIYDTPANNPPSMIAGATAVSVSPTNRYGSNNTVISAIFSDSDEPGINAFNVIFKIREPNDITELTLVNNMGHGAGGLTITDNGGGSYTAQYTYNPDDAQNLGLYDLYFEVTDGTDNLIDAFDDNLNELEIDETLPATAPTITAGATIVSASPVNRIDANTTVISATFSDVNEPAPSSFLVTFKIREPNDITELTLVDALTDGNGGLTVVDNGGGSYTASYTYDPDVAQTLGLYDLYCEIDDNTGTANAVDGYDNNLNELEINEVISNLTPVIVASATGVDPGSIDRGGAITTTISVPFTDGDQPGINEFFIKIRVSAPYFQGVTIVADSLKHGQGGLTITDGGGGSYTASIDWDPPDNAVTGYYDLQAIVADQLSYAIDDYDANPDELLITNGGENSAPIVSTDATFASPAGIERIGTNPTTISATFVDGDAPAVSVFTVSFKLREPDDIGEIVLATNVQHGVSGVTISDLGGGVYEASVDWDPADGQTLGFYDLYFDVTEGSETSFDNYSYNENELEVYDAISNNAPTVVPGATSVIPTSFTRIGTDFTIIKTLFSDQDTPGAQAFTVTYKVQDAFSTEYTLVNAATHGNQGLRIRHVSGADYEASFVWDPGDLQETGFYDLYFYVEDNASDAATDPYASNDNEVELLSTTPLGDGYLLRRNNIASSCGGTASACHNVVDHQSQDCLVCHTSHGTENIYLIRETITTPSSGDKPVLFKTLGTPDPYNTVPLETDDAGGSMASDANTVQNEICEVCHRTTSYYRNDNSHTSKDHHNVENCVTACHPHADAFAGSGGEPDGGDGCGCHSSIVTPMQTTSGYHHMILSTNANYDTAQRTCLMCHVHHDIFSPDFNAGFGTRAANLRVDITTSVVKGDASVMLNSDYQSSGDGGICLSCHTSAQPKSYTQPDGTSQTPAISKPDYDAATSAHNYDVASSTWGDGSSFNANCIKCHDDDMSNSYGDYGTHDGSYRRILNPMGIASPSDPLEEDHCLACHSTGDYYGVKSMSAASTAIDAALGRAYGHPTTTYRGRHKPVEDSTNLGDSNRHAECEDCHNPHAVRQGTHDGSTSLASNALKGTWGVRVTTWPTPVTPSDNANVFTAPGKSDYDVVTDGTVKEYEICLKCHSNYTTLPSGSRNIAEEINPNYPSTHGITIANQNSYCNTTTMFEPWGSSGLTYCSDCHTSDQAGDPKGPHGSNSEHLLVASIVSDDVAGTPLCDVCHDPLVYWDVVNGSAATSRFDQHPATKGAHQLAQGCFACHMWDYASSDVGDVSTVMWDGGNPDTKLFVHGQNKRWVYQDRYGTGTAGSGDSTDAFVNGMMSNMDYDVQECWSEVCKTHSATGYAP